MYNFYMQNWVAAPSLALLLSFSIGTVDGHCQAFDEQKDPIQAAVTRDASVPGEQAAKMAKAVAPMLRFRVKLISAIDGSVAQVGDTVHGELLDTVMMPDGKFIGAGAHVIGEITEVDLKKSSLKSDFSPKHWRNCNGTICIKITRVCEHQFINDIIPAPKTRIERVDKKAVTLGVDGKGEITVQYNSAGYTAANVAISGGCIAAGPAGLIVRPIVGGVAGATDPTFAYGRPVTQEDSHPHMKGFFKGVIGGLPGGFFISGLTNHGINVSLAPGDVIVFQERTPKTD